MIHSRFALFFLHSLHFWSFQACQCTPPNPNPFRAFASLCVYSVPALRDSLPRTHVRVTCLFIRPLSRIPRVTTVRLIKMRVNWGNPSIFLSISVIFESCYSLPLNEQRVPQPNVLAPRATYSVVPINGGRPSSGPGSGSGSGSGQGNPAVTVVHTVVETAPPKTSIQTVYKSSPPTTDTVFVTKTVPIVPIQPNPTTTTTIIYAASSTSTSPTAVPATSAITISTTSSTISLQTSTLPVSSLTSSLPISYPSLGLATPSTIVASIIASSATTSPPLQTSSGVSSSSSSTYDDGMWHTTYPAWNGTSLARRQTRPRPRQTV
ncbi:hypothetical protein B0H66DRAFT_558030 [Apodospora peruviana]|uniref:Uncharacterized protein n=1 Tax=Apodospora peruviana TaxID=516989 RepID=A0AAE0I5C3_9PEZI|nr:hypothetical protein B0H66DRAFT_558030 [Apodospora peruviana]